DFFRISFRRTCVACRPQVENVKASSQSVFAFRSAPATPDTLRPSVLRGCATRSPNRGGRTRDRTLDLSRVKAELGIDFAKLFPVEGAFHVNSTFLMLPIPWQWRSAIFAKSLAFYDSVGPWPQTRKLNGPITRSIRGSVAQISALDVITAMLRHGLS